MKKNKLKIMVLTVPVLFFREKGSKDVIADCRALGIFTYGKNLKDAKKMFKEALQLWCESVMADGNLKETLLELGWKITDENVQLPEETPFEPSDIPVELLSSTNQDFSIQGNLL